MKEIYIKHDGVKVTIEVSDKVADDLKELRRETWRNEKNHSNHCTSLESIESEGSIFADKKPTPEEQLITEEESVETKQSLKKAIATLSEEQQRLVYWIYYKGISQDDVAKKLGVTKAAVSNRMTRIYAQLKKSFQKNKNL